MGNNQRIGVSHWSSWIRYSFLSHDNVVSIGQDPFVFFYRLAFDIVSALVDQVFQRRSRLSAPFKHIVDSSLDTLDIGETHLDLHQPGTVNHCTGY